MLHAIKPKSMCALRSSLSLIGSCLGIFLPETLRSIKFLLADASWIKDFLSPYISIPKPKELEPSYFKKVGLTIGSLFILGFSLFTLD